MREELLPSLQALHNHDLSQVATTAVEIGTSSHAESLLAESADGLRVGSSLGPGGKTKNWEMHQRVVDVDSISSSAHSSGGTGDGVVPAQVRRQRAVAAADDVCSCVVVTRTGEIYSAGSSGWSCKSQACIVPHLLLYRLATTMNPTPGIGDDRKGAVGASSRFVQNKRGRNRHSGGTGGTMSGTEDEEEEEEERDEKKGLMGLAERIVKSKSKPNKSISQKAQRHRVGDKNNERKKLRKKKVRTDVTADVLQSLELAWS